MHQVLPAFPSVVLDQLRTLFRDFVPHAIKLGMLATDDVLRAVRLGLGELDHRKEPPPPRVIDPVLRASDGTWLLERRALAGLREMLEGTALVTPNLPEAETLCERDVSTRAGVEAAARDLVAGLGAGAALVKGGHASGAPDDCLALREEDGVAVRWLAGRRIPGGPVHGTGCALASAVAAGLARGEALPAAVDAGRAFVASAIERAVAVGGGARLLDFS